LFCQVAVEMAQAHSEMYSQDADEDWARVGYQSLANPDDDRPDSAEVMLPVLILATMYRAL